jgi:UDPglucose 6-dehydrogenase
VSLGIGLDERIGKRFLQAGPGYGGSCFPKDTLALMRTARDAGAPVELIETTVRINDARKQAMAQKIVQAMGGDVQGKTIAVLGLTFKPNTDDMRDAPSLEILPALQAEGARIRAFDPEGMHEAQRHFKNIDYAASTTDAIEGADALVILTEWDAFKAIELGKLKTMLSAPIVVDLRNMFSIAEMNRYGIRHFGVGRPENSRQISNAKELHDVSC